MALLRAKCSMDSENPSSTGQWQASTTKNRACITDYKYFLYDCVKEKTDDGNQC